MLKEKWKGEKTIVVNSDEEKGKFMQTDSYDWKAVHAKCAFFQNALDVSRVVHIRTFSREAAGVLLKECSAFVCQLQIQSLFTSLTKGFGILLICVGVQQELAHYGHRLHVAVNSGLLRKTRSLFINPDCIS